MTRGTYVTLEGLNRADREAFVAALGAIFEASPWVAEQAYPSRPFATISDLHQAMAAAVRDAGREAQVALIRAHPDLGARVHLSPESASEQAGAGLDRLSASEYAQFQKLNQRYRRRFGFPFIVAVKRQTKATILRELERRLEQTEPAEIDQALEEISAIARYRLEEAVMERVESETQAPGPGHPTAIRYGKAQVTVYRTYARPLEGVPAIPESAFRGRENVLFGLDVDVDVFGDNFLPAYTVGDNSNVVATDTMKNFVQQMALDYAGATLEGFLAFLGRRLLETYDQMQGLRLAGQEVPFVAAPVPGDGGFTSSAVLFSRSRADRAFAELELEREGSGGRISGHRCGRQGLQLIKVKGSAFTRFVRDGHTTLPEQVDRPLFIYLDVSWRYGDVDDAVGEDAARYVAAEQVRDVCQVTFHEFVSQSIQHLVHEMGQRLLGRFPQLKEVSFEAQNRLWDTAVVAETDQRVKVYCDPRPPYGRIALTLTRR